MRIAAAAPKTQRKRWPERAFDFGAAGVSGTLFSDKIHSDFHSNKRHQDMLRRKPAKESSIKANENSFG
jgi:hypothetical protein